MTAKKYLDGYNNDLDGLEDMVEQVKNNIEIFITNPRQRDLADKIINAMRHVDRRFFVKDADPYQDRAIYVHSGQTISQPSTVARMLMLLCPQKGDKVLEVGTSSGWNACLISDIIAEGKVISIEKIPELVKIAKKNIKVFFEFNSKDLSKKIEIKNKSIFDIGKDERFDRIIITAGMKDERQHKAIIDIGHNNLNKGGSLVCPYEHGPLMILSKQDKVKITYTKEEYVFVPLR